MSKYLLPEFTAFSPQFINLSIREIKNSHLFNSNYENKPDLEKFKQAFSKLSHQQELTKRDIRVLSHYIVSLEKHNLFEDFYKVMVLKVNEIRNKSYFIRPFLNYLYNGDNVIFKEKIYNLIKIFKRMVNKYKEKYYEVFKLMDENSSVVNFLENIQTQFLKINERAEIESLCNSYFIKNTDVLYFNCISNFIFSNYLREALWGFHRATVEKLGLPLQKQLLKKILLEYKHISNIETYPGNWFNLIGIILGEPYDPANPRWNGFTDEEKDIYRRWNNDVNLEKFFEQIVGGDKRRKHFWKQYINNIYRVEYFKDASQALVMEFKHHLFIEFAQQKNALYYYDKDTLNINMIRLRLGDTTMSKSRKTQFLKKDFPCLDSMRHVGGWEYNFHYRMQSLGYQKGRWY